MYNFPNIRARRLRLNKNIRDLIQETSLTTNDLIYPVFIIEGKKQQITIPSMPGIERLSLDNLIKITENIVKLKIKAIALFPVISNDKKSLLAREAYNSNGLIQKAIKLLKQNFPDLLIITDVALDPFTKHGQDGIINETGYVLNDKTNQILIKQAISHAEAGADIIAPSDMMDGRIGLIRQEFEKSGFVNTKILAYAVKYASNFYSPFRDALSSNELITKDKHQYQMDFYNSDEALKEVQMDITEGADIVMIKPGMPYLDIIYKVKQTFKFPTFAYQVSGEYAMLKAAIQNGWLNKPAILESIIAIKRAGADAILTYSALEIAEIIQNQ